VPNTWRTRPPCVGGCEATGCPHTREARRMRGTITHRSACVRQSRARSSDPFRPVGRGDPRAHEASTCRGPTSAIVEFRATSPGADAGPPPLFAATMSTSPVHDGDVLWRRIDTPNNRKPSARLVGTSPPGSRDQEIRSVALSVPQSALAEPARSQSPGCRLGAHPGEAEHETVGPARAPHEVRRQRRGLHAPRRRTALWPLDRPPVGCIFCRARGG